MARRIWTMRIHHMKVSRHFVCHWYHRYDTVTYHQRLTLRKPLMICSYCAVDGLQSRCRQQKLQPASGLDRASPVCVLLPSKTAVSEIQCRRHWSRKPQRIVLRLAGMDWEPVCVDDDALIVVAIVSNTPTYDSKKSTRFWFSDVVFRISAISKASLRSSLISEMAFRSSLTSAAIWRSAEISEAILRSSMTYDAILRSLMTSCLKLFNFDISLKQNDTLPSVDGFIGDADVITLITVQPDCSGHTLLPFLILRLPETAQPRMKGKTSNRLAIV
jgi:hypothetical protein